MSTILPEDLWTNLPGDITRAILGRLPLGSVASCKCVCKSWRDLIGGAEFETSYTRKPWLAFHDEHKWCLVSDGAFRPILIFQLHTSHFGHLNSCGNGHVVIDSANGLLLVRHACDNILVICNPLTREYARLPHLPTNLCFQKSIFGFGVSKISGQYKILYGDENGSCYIYTLVSGGLWRSVTVATPSLPHERGAPCLNGNLHWLVSDLEGNNLLVGCFDLETELYTDFSLPLAPSRERDIHKYCLRVLEDRLCLCDTSDQLHADIWKMNNYGDTESWVREYTFDIRGDIFGLVSPLNVLENGDLVFATSSTNRLFKNSKSTNTIATYGFFRRVHSFYYSSIAFYTPSFLSLSIMGIDNVESFKGIANPLIL